MISFEQMHRFEMPLADHLCKRVNYIGILEKRDISKKHIRRKTGRVWSDRGDK